MRRQCGLSARGARPGAPSPSMLSDLCAGSALQARQGAGAERSVDA
jgi:hypothetical protein